MLQLNPHYKKLQPSYLFVEIARRVQEHRRLDASRSLIKLGIGDVTHPLPPSLIRAFQDAVQEQSVAESFRGYGPEQGYAFLREAIAQGDFISRDCPISAHDIFISDGSKCDTGNFQELFAQETRVALPDPVYPVYVDTNVMAGRTGEAIDGRYKGLIYLESREANGFVPSPADLPSDGADVVYLCFPNNPTGVTATKKQLRAWVDWARSCGALILFDAAYEAFVKDPDLPRSIYEIPGAETCAVEFRSFSKNAGFTGTRCAYTVVPEGIRVGGESLHAFWNRRHSTKFNGVSYPVQRAAEAVYSPQGRLEIQALVDAYGENARLIRDALDSVNCPHWGGENSPYVWIKTEESSWKTFDRLLKEADVVVSPGSGFGTMGENFIRISAFNDKESVQEAMRRLVRVWES